ncbi:class I ribonucleotide reductase maintenance protein YfaE [Pectobacteriaceae bacterium CE70]|uniref:2Fe-2S ferredoxin n=1 Tax=Serratia sp. (strain ATCC 39006) TaxID=104623 RepID=A0A2I5TAS7_SERS3|nr:MULTISPECIES: class I ribonucleotide reductase maintenance protein YfaE [Enterobacterales]WJV59463.1 class I ribonucleotide reductase maintenance protein YfaE [Pectobacteriaceae bacterium C111]WJV63709.1 class I ribonucleotide reductase maintenance protein YfaE [Pectobacteriaceae bacterium C52]WJV68102.1 class I ribonucleotide reductase maintenance protein YfaE [Pectobacteriaceae bacterium CE70]WJY12041.1 class I ribonucleotide reductase maintenance protein YfaE [Pectobacteriaceae bacterium 
MNISTITLRISGAQLSCSDEHSSLLDVLESHRINVDYQCRSGYCGACRTRLLKGSVVYRQAPLACLRQDEILPCCCMPVDDIELDI